MLNVLSTPFPPIFSPPTCFTDTTYCLTDATDWNQIKPLCNSARGWIVWSSVRSQTQVVSASSASMSAASTCDQPSEQRHEFPAGVRRDDHRFRGSYFTSTFPNIPEHQAATSITSKKRKLQEGLLRKMITHKIQEGLDGDNGMTLTTKIGHPCFTKMSINKSRLDQDTRAIRRITRLTDQMRSRRNKLRAKPLIRTRSKILTNPVSPSNRTRTLTMTHNLEDKLIKKS